MVSKKDHRRIRKCYRNKLLRLSILFMCMILNENHYGKNVGWIQHKSNNIVVYMNIIIGNKLNSNIHYSKWCDSNIKDIKLNFQQFGILTVLHSTGILVIIRFILLNEDDLSIQSGLPKKIHNKISCVLNLYSFSFLLL